MSGNSRHQALIDQLFRDRDAEYRRASKAEQQLKEMRQSWQKKKKLFGNEIKRLRQKITVSPN